VKELEDILRTLPPRADRRKNGERRIPGRNPDEDRFIRICIMAGARYQGVFQPTPEVEAVVMFADGYGSTCGIPASQISFETVKARLEKSNASWAAAERKGNGTRLGQ
jgi:hypothetical protein